MKCARCGDGLGRGDTQIYIFFPNKAAMFLCKECGKELQCWISGSCPIDYDTNESK